MKGKWKKIWNDDLPGFHDRFHCPECFGFELFIGKDHVQYYHYQQPTVVNNTPSRMKCKCGWTGLSTELLDKDEMKNTKRVKLIDEMCKE